MAAAEQGNVNAQSLLYEFYAQGYCGKVDYVQAYKWMMIAEMNGYNASTNRPWLFQKMTLKQKQQGQQLVKEYIANKKRQAQSSLPR